MKVHRPTNNRLTRGFISGHPAYDFAGLNLPDEVRAGKDGTIIERADLYVNNWSSTPPLTTRDYGNYIKIKHDDGSFELHAHLRKGSSFVVGTKVKAGQTVARIGNTGNSTGPHLHSEYRNASNQNIQVEFVDNSQSDNMEISKEKFEELVMKATEADALFKYFNLQIGAKKSEEIISRVQDREKIISTQQEKLLNQGETLRELSEQVRVLTEQVQDKERLREKWYTAYGEERKAKEFYMEQVRKLQELAKKTDLTQYPIKQLLKAVVTKLTDKYLA